MAINESYLKYIEDQLSEFGDFETKRMFGGIGFFRNGIMFGMIGNDVFRLKVDETNQMDYINLGMKPYHSGSKKKGMPYWEVPVAIVEDKKVLSEWVKRSLDIAIKAIK